MHFIWSLCEFVCWTRSPSATNQKRCFHPIQQINRPRTLYIPRLQTKWALLPPSLVTLKKERWKLESREPMWNRVVRFKRVISSPPDGKSTLIWNSHEMILASPNFVKFTERYITNFYLSQLYIKIKERSVKIHCFLTSTIQQQLNHNQRRIKTI